jgi:hypothetical protein
MALGTRTMRNEKEMDGELVAAMVRFFSTEAAKGIEGRTKVDDLIPSQVNVLLPLPAPSSLSETSRTSLSSYWVSETINKHNCHPPLFVSVLLFLAFLFSFALSTALTPFRRVQSRRQVLGPPLCSSLQRIERLRVRCESIGGDV